MSQVDAGGATVFPYIGARVLPQKVKTKTLKTPVSKQVVRQTEDYLPIFSSQY